jgi:hypothetical protein
MRFDKLLVLGVIFLLPFDASEYGHFNMLSIDFSLVDILIFISLFFVGLKQFATRARFWITPDLVICLFLVAATSLPNIAWASKLIPNLKITLNCLEYLALFYVFAQVIRDEAFLKTILRLFLVLTTCMVILTILMSLGWSVPGYQRKDAFNFLMLRIGVVGLEGQFVTGFSLFLLGAIPLLWQKTLIERRWLSLVFTPLYLIAAFVTGSRSLYVSLSCQALFWIYLGYIRNLSVGKKVIVSAGYGAGIAVIGWNIMNIIDYLKGFRPVTFVGRGEGYLLALKVVFSNPLFFLFGFGKSEFMTLNHHRMVHNFFLDFLVTSGALTLLVVLALLAIIFIRLATVPGGANTSSGQIRTALMVGFFGSIFVGMFDPTTTSINLWIYLAIIYAFSLIPRERVQSPCLAKPHRVKWVRA